MSDSQIQNNDCPSAVELHRILMACLTRKYELADMAASAMADDLALEIRREVGGAEIYIPCPNREQRNREIVREYNGRNVAELAKKHGLSERHIHRVVAKASL